MPTFGETHIRSKINEHVTDWPDAKESEDWLQRKFGDARVWLLSVPGGGRLWNEFRSQGFIAVGWDYLGDLSEYAAREEIQAAISGKEGRDNPRNSSLAVWQFSHDMQPGDIVIAKKGISVLYGWGRISGDYAYEPERGEYQHIRTVDWKKTGSWNLVGD